MSRSWMQSQLSQSHGPLRPPPPIAPALAQRAPKTPPIPAQNDPLTTIARQTHALERDLQTYLDAQADGLLAGLHGEAVLTPTDNGNLSASYMTAPPPASQMLGSSRLLPVRQPRAKKTSLSQARRGMWDTMGRLSDLKASESAILSDALAQDEQTLHKIDNWQKKRDNIDQEMHSVQQDSHGDRAQQLREEDNALKDEIQKIETHLAELKSQQRAVRHELTTLENGVQAKLSSYRESSRLLERDISTFLKRPPNVLPGLVRQHDSDSPKPLETYLNLPPARRTLAMAREHVQTERELTEKRLDVVTSELHALEEGSAVWNDVAGEITRFERALQRQIKMLGMLDGQQAGNQGRNVVLKQLDETIALLQAKLHLAETKGWNLLVVAIGSELEAMQQGRHILREALGGEAPPVGSGDEGSDGGLHSPHAGDDHPLRADETVDSPTDGDADGAASPVLRSAVLDPPRPQAAAAPMAQLDEEPDPELLLSH